jgi:hypothetical protein
MQQSLGGSATPAARTSLTLLSSWFCMQLVGRSIKLSWAVHRQPASSQSWDRNSTSSMGGSGGSAEFGSGEYGTTSGTPQQRYGRQQQRLHPSYSEDGVLLAPRGREPSPSAPVAVLPVMAASPGECPAWVCLTGSVSCGLRLASLPGPSGPLIMCRSQQPTARVSCCRSSALCSCSTPRERALVCLPECPHSRAAPCSACLNVRTQELHLVLPA